MHSLVLPGSLTPGMAGAWTPFQRRTCSFGSDVFLRTMLNFVRHPNLNTSWLFRADILFDDGDHGNHDVPPASAVQPRCVEVQGFHPTRTIVRRLIPRNTRRDQPLDQTCVLYEGNKTTQSPSVCSLVVYIPHETDPARLPFYHPKVRGVAHLHEWDPATNAGAVSVHFCLFDNGTHDDDDGGNRKRLDRTALQLLGLLHKHGQGQAAGYVKRVQHDVLVAQVRSQDRYTQLKLKHAHALCASWAEKTNPIKHVFEDLAIAAFLIELWADMYGEVGEQGSRPFPGFVDIGCGNGLLVHILRQEGYAGWGFDARERKSWGNYQTAGAGPNGKSLEALVLLPRLAVEAKDTTTTTNKLLSGKRPRWRLCQRHVYHLEPRRRAHAVDAATRRCVRLPVPLDPMLQSQPGRGTVARAAADEAQGRVRVCVSRRLGDANRRGLWLAR